VKPVAPMVIRPAELATGGKYMYCRQRKWPLAAGFQGVLRVLFWGNFYAVWFAA
jgi:hypothetical protein